ncbi:hypothetical protein DXA96_16995 [Lachnospiraceae bacterium OF09-33XD]|nr:hypothetical protein DXA96_16995 [Lachnospiraceae bacterium OF09-33XD]
MRKRKSNYRKASKKTRRMIRWSVVGVVVLALLLFWGLFYITEVEVVGNTRYTEKEVENMALEASSPTIPFCFPPSRGILIWMISRLWNP